MIGGGLIIAGQRVTVHHVDVVTWQDDPRTAPRVTDGRERPAGSALAIVMHTSKGRRAKVRDGARPSDKGERLARYQARTARRVSWHLTGDTDGGVFQQADLDTWMAWHVEEANGWTVGYELVQHDDDPTLYRVQIDAAVAVIEATCAALRIPRRLFVGPDGEPWLKPIPDLLMRKYGGPGGRWAGVLGHCQLVPDDVRGPGDPGDAIFRALLEAGFEGVVVPQVVTRVVSTGAPPTTWSAPPVPLWVDVARQIPDRGERFAVTPEAWAREAWVHLRALSVPLDAAVEVIAHCAVECSWGTRAVGHNHGGVKLKRRDDAAFRAKHGRGLAWWSAPGHRASGDDDVEVYRGFDDDEAFWAFFVKRYAPRPDTEAESDRYEDAGAALWGPTPARWFADTEAESDRYEDAGAALWGPTPARWFADTEAESDRYEDAGAALWGPTPARWFVELVLAGYRGEVRERELEELDAHGAANEHPSVKGHRDVVRRVRMLLHAS